MKHVKLLGELLVDLCKESVGSKKTVLAGPSFAAAEMKAYVRRRELARPVNLSYICARRLLRILWYFFVHIRGGSRMLPLFFQMDEMGAVLGPTLDSFLSGVLFIFLVSSEIMDQYAVVFGGGRRNSITVKDLKRPLQSRTVKSSSSEG